jgi:excisionase family DNA binding protein
MKAKKRIQAEYLDKKTAAELLDMHPDTFRTHVAPHLTIYMVGKRVKFKKSEIEQFMEGKKIC